MKAVQAGRTDIVNLLCDNKADVNQKNEITTVSADLQDACHDIEHILCKFCLLYTSPSPRD